MDFQWTTDRLCNIPEVVLPPKYSAIITFILKSFALFIITDYIIHNKSNFIALIFFSRTYVFNEVIFRESFRFAI